jgi:hypothetical protein
MDACYIAPDDESLTEAIKRYTIWFDRKLEKPDADQSVDQNRKSA